jgi:hypothetical protein
MVLPPPATAGIGERSGELGADGLGGADVAEFGPEVEVVEAGVGDVERGREGAAGGRGRGEGERRRAEGVGDASEVVETEGLEEVATDVSGVRADSEGRDALWVDQQAHDGGKDGASDRRERAKRTGGELASGPDDHLTVAGASEAIRT